MSESWEGLERVLTSFRVPGVDETLHSVGAGRWRAMGRAALCDRQGLDMEDGRRDYSGWLHSRRDAFAGQLNVSSPPILCVGDGRFCVAALCCQDVHFSPAFFRLIDEPSWTGANMSKSAGSQQGVILILN